MKYILLIYTQETEENQLDKAEMDALMGEYFAFTDEVAKSGAMVGADQLQPIRTATTVRLRDGKTLTTDGPFAETHEQLGGYYIVECNNLDEAIGWAAKIPGAKTGSIEVRPLVELR